LFDTEMPRKVRPLIADLEKAGFVNRGGKGSHRNFIHAKGQRVTLSGGLGEDALPYQESQVRRRIEESKQ
jgi:predicted RNA binding protein YcfA (HicA-like mRNA interferase family)